MNTKEHKYGCATAEEAEMRMRSAGWSDSEIEEELESRKWVRNTKTDFSGIDFGKRASEAVVMRETQIQTYGKTNEILRAEEVARTVAGRSISDIHAVSRAPAPAQRREHTVATVAKNAKERAYEQRKTERMKQGEKALKKDRKTLCR